MTVAIDRDGDWMQVVWDDSGRLAVRSQRLCYALVSDTAANRGLLQRAGVPFGGWEGRLVLIGNYADEYGGVFGTTALSLSPGLTREATDPLSRLLWMMFLEYLIPAPRRSGEASILSEMKGDSTEKRIALHLEQRGFQVFMASPATSLILATQVDQAFSGLGIRFGQRRTALSLVENSHEIRTWTIDTGLVPLETEFLRQAHEVSYSVGTEAERYIKACTSSPGKVMDGPWRTIAGEIIKDWLTEILEEVWSDLEQLEPRHWHSQWHPSSVQPQDARRLPVVCTGSVVQWPGFRQAFESLLDSPLRSGTQIRIVSDEPYVIGRGHLIQAELVERMSPIPTPHFTLRRALQADGVGSMQGLR